MLPSYDDITSLTDKQPDWWDEQGVPRYAPFRPSMLGVYDHYAVLVEIACQACRCQFLVGVGITRYSFGLTPEDAKLTSMQDLVENFHYGDPPRHDPCHGAAMNCHDLRIVQAWQRNSKSKSKSKLEWERASEFEGRITPQRF